MESEVLWPPMGQWIIFVAQVVGCVVMWALYTERARASFKNAVIMAVALVAAVYGMKITPSGYEAHWMVAVARSIPSAIGVFFTILYLTRILFDSPSKS